jgi:hypothetical protein
MSRPRFEEELEIGLRNNSTIPLDSDIIVCLATGWSWHELMAAPAWVVADLKTYMQKQGVVSRERSAMLKGLQNGCK